MTNLNITVPEEVRAFIESQLSEGGYASASDYLLALVHDAQEREARRVVAARLHEALDSGPDEPFTTLDWAAIRQEVHRRHAARQA